MPEKRVNPEERVNAQEKMPWVGASRLLEGWRNEIAIGGAPWGAAGSRGKPYSFRGVPIVELASLLLVKHQHYRNLTQNFKCCEKLSLKPSSCLSPGDDCCPFPNGPAGRCRMPFGEVSRPSHGGQRGLVRRPNPNDIRTFELSQANWDHRPVRPWPALLPGSVSRQYSSWQHVLPRSFRSERRCGRGGKSIQADIAVATDVRAARAWSRSFPGDGNGQTSPIHQARRSAAHRPLRPSRLCLWV